MKRLLILVAVTLLTVPATARAQEPDLQEMDPGEEMEVEPLEASPRELRAGEQVMVTGQGCTGGSEVWFHLYYPQEQSNLSVSAPTHADGSFGRMVRIPHDAPSGRVWLTATCPVADSDEDRAMQTVLVISPPEFLITWTNVFFGAGSALIVMGAGVAILQRRHDRRRGVAGQTKKKKKKRRRKRSRSRARSKSSGTG